MSRRPTPTDAWIALGGATAMAVGAQISVPMIPVPTTLQTLAVVLLGLTVGPDRALGAAALYLAGVVAGLPILSSGQQHGGLAFLDFLAAGYVVGFLPGAWVAGRLGHGRELGRMILAGLVSHAVVLALGVSVMMVWIQPQRAIDKGLLPFLLGAVVKSAVAAGIVWAWRRWGRS